MKNYWSQDELTKWGIFKSLVRCRLLECWCDVWCTAAALHYVICLSCYNDSIICCCLGNRHICFTTQAGHIQVLLSPVCAGECECGSAGGKKSHTLMYLQIGRKPCSHKYYKIVLVYVCRCSSSCDILSTKLFFLLSKWGHFWKWEHFDCSLQLQITFEG